MSFGGVCQICESAEASHSCERCGALVCDEHYDLDLNMCTQCASQVRQAGGDTGGGDDSGPGPQL